jgi:prefoldin beta subunit
MDLKKETQNKIQELQTIEQNLNSLLMQKQTFQIELSETENALSEIAKSDDDVYKLVGQIMVKSDKADIEKELKKKQELLTLRMSSIEKQEKTFAKQAEELRSEVMKEMK